MRVTLKGQLDFGTYECPSCLGTTYFAFWQATTVEEIQIRYAVCPKGHLFTEDSPDTLTPDQKAKLIGIAQKQ